MCMRKHTLVFFVLISIYSLLPEVAFALTRDIQFPVDAEAHFKNDFADPRGGGTRQHLGIDIMTDKMTPIFSAVDGVVTYVLSPEASWGYSLGVRDIDGYVYKYLHLNNDTPGTDDGKGGEAHAYAPGITRDIPVHKGELLGWVGDSGNAESVGAHLHFEIWSPMHSAINPYESLVRAASSSSNVTISDSSSSAKKPEVITVLRGDKMNYVFTKQLKRGMTSAEVKQLQIKLKSLGYLKVTTPTNYFGTATRAAVIALQKKHKLAETGALGPKTRAILNASV